MRRDGSARSSSAAASSSSSTRGARRPARDRERASLHPSGNRRRVPARARPRAVRGEACSPRRSGRPGGRAGRRRARRTGIRAGSGRRSLRHPGRRHPSCRARNLGGQIRRVLWTARHVRPGVWYARELGRGSGERLDRQPRSPRRRDVPERRGAARRDRAREAVRVRALEEPRLGPARDRRHDPVVGDGGRDAHAGRGPECGP